MSRYSGNQAAGNGVLFPGLVSLFKQNIVDSHKLQMLKARLLFGLQIAGLCATGWVVWHVAILPRLASESLPGILSGALVCALIAACSSAWIALGMYLVISRHLSTDAFRLALRTSATAIWFAPATILLSALSPAALAAALVLVVSTTRLLFSQWLQIQPPVRPEYVPIAELAFALPPSPLFRRDLIPGIAASLAVQAGLVAILLGYPFLSSAMFCLGIAMLTLSTLVAGVFQADRVESLPRSFLGVLLTMVLAAGLTVGGLAIQYGGSLDGPGGPSNRPGPLDRTAELLRKLVHKPNGGTPIASATKVFLPPASNTEVTDKSFPGVVLWTQAVLQEKLIAPASKSWLNRTNTRPQEPLSIPFSGQYWMLKGAYSVPPERSLSERGTPLELSFVTTDRRPMSMAAHQKLDHPIDLSCCRAIQIDIWNADRYPGTVSLELILRDSTASGTASESLGVKDVTAWPRWHWSGKPTLPATELLEFSLPESGALREFDEFEVVFHRHRLRSERSARISIDRFVLVP